MFEAQKDVTLTQDDKVLIQSWIKAELDMYNSGTNTSELKMEWKGAWEDKCYDKFDVVVDGAYTGIVNNPLGTNERLAPQDIGYAGYLYDGTLSDYSQLAKQIIFGTRYVAQTAIKLTGYRVDVVAGNEYHLYIITDPLGTPIINALHSFTPDITGWVLVDSAETIVGNGLTFDIICEVNEPAGTPTITTLNYDYDTPNNVGTPGNGEIIHANNDLAYLHISTTDNDGNDNTTFLQGLTVGDIIELDTIRWSIQSVVNNAGYVTFQVSPTVQYGSDGVYGFNFETVTSTPITIGYELDYNLTYPMSGLYIVDGKYSDIVPDNNQYGVDIEVQEISISDDWDIVATNGTSANSSVESTDSYVHVRALGGLDYIPITVSGQWPIRQDIEDALALAGFTPPYKSGQSIFVGSSKAWVIEYISSIDKFYAIKLREI